MQREIEVQRATSVLNTAKSFDVIDDELPVDEQTRIDLANLIIDKARKARERGENGDHVTQILWAAEVEIGEDGEEQYNAEEDSDEASYKKAIQEEIEDSLPVPPEIDVEIPNIPQDFNDLSDKQIIRLIGIYNACQARANWLYAIEEAGQAAAKSIADYYEDKYIISADRKDVGGKSKTAQLLKAEAKENYPDILKWRKREKEHSRKANKYSRLRDNWDNTCDRLSRIWTIKNEERQHS